MGCLGYGQRPCQPSMQQRAPWHWTQCHPQPKQGMVLAALAQHLQGTVLTASPCKAVFGIASQLKLECCCRLVGGSCARQRFKARKKRSETLPRNSWGECRRQRAWNALRNCRGEGRLGRGAAGPYFLFFRNRNGFVNDQ